MTSYDYVTFLGNLVHFLDFGTYSWGLVHCLQLREFGTCYIKFGTQLIHTRKVGTNLSRMCLRKFPIYKDLRFNLLIDLIYFSGHLRSVKHYFLLDQGDFIVQFLDLCESELLQSVNCVEPSRLESLLELAQRTSGANTDPYKDNVGVELLPYDLIFQVSILIKRIGFQYPKN